MVEVDFPFHPVSSPQRHHLPGLDCLVDLEEYNAVVLDNLWPDIAGLLWVQAGAVGLGEVWPEIPGV